MGVVTRNLQRAIGLIRWPAAVKAARLAAAPAPQPTPPQAPARKGADSEARHLYERAMATGSWEPVYFSVGLGVAPCNHSCIFCPQSVQKPEKARWLQLDLLRKVLNEMPEDGIQIGLSSYSETIAAPNLVPVVRLMKELRPKLRIAMASNGTLFREQVVSDLIDAGLDHYSYSFDGATREDYVKLMQHDDFDRVWQNLEKLVELRARKSSKMMITTHIMAFEGRRRDFERFRDYWKDKVDGVQWRTLSNWGGDNWGLEKRMAAVGFLPEHKTPAKRYPCFSILHHFKLQWDGSYYPCVAAVPDWTEEVENHCVPRLGHANEITWAEAWDRLKGMQQAHLEGRWDDFEACRSCNVWSVYEDIWTEKTLPDGGKRFVVEG
jgi:pyruvate-formate lyase-activating enzyme